MLSQLQISRNWPGLPSLRYSETNCRTAILSLGMRARRHLLLNWLLNAVCTILAAIVE